MRQNTWSYKLIQDRTNFQMIKADVTEGLVIVLVVAISLIVIISFADFLRFHWVNDPAEVQRREQRREQRQARQNNNAPQVQRRMWRNLNIQQRQPPNLRQPIIPQQPIIQRQPIMQRQPIIQNQLNLQEQLQQQQQQQQQQQEAMRRNETEAKPSTDNTSNEFKRIDSNDSDVSFHLDRNQLRELNNEFQDEAELIPDATPNQDGELLEPIVNHQQRIEPEHEEQEEEVNNVEDVEEDIDIDDDPQLGEVEIHIAVDNILGLREPAYNLLRNVLWLISFIGFYVGVFASVPQIIGNALHHIFSRFTIFNSLSEFEPLKFMIDLIIKVNDVCKSSQDAIHLFDVFHVGLGYTTIITVVFICNAFVYVLRKYIVHSNILKFVVEIMNSLALMVKVGTLLYIRIFALPVFLGAIILYCANSFYDYSLQAWVDFITYNLVGGISLAWVVGISYMLTVTLSVLQLREVLHPDVLAKAIRPQEPHIDLLNSLMHESGFTHCRRVFASMFVYLIILALFIHLPMQLTTMIFKKPEEDIHMAHFIPKLQLPLELALTHIIFLTILDKKKNIIGNVQHNWMIFISRHLGLTRFILPLPTKRSEGNDQILCDRDGVPIVGLPLRRPPVGWDARHTRNMTRWAWGTETPSDVEKTIAPRVVPTYWFLRICVLILATWIFLVVGMVFLLIGPLSLGRLLFKYLDLPSFLRHDPLLFVLGAFIFTMPMSFLARLCTKTKTWRKKLYSDLKIHITSILISRQLVQLFFKNLLFWMLSEFCIGFMVQIFLLKSIDELLLFSTVCRIYLKGSLLMAIFMSCLLSDRYVPRILSYLSIENKFVNWAREFKVNVLNRALTPLQTFQWDSEIPRLHYLWNNCVHPWFNAIVIRNTIPVVILGMITSKLCEVHTLGDHVLKLLGKNDSISCMKIYVSAITIYYLTRIFSTGLYRSYIKLCKTIRDESYLIGKVLQNHTDHETN